MTSFSEIKKRLDAGSSYVVFEKIGVAVEREPFREIKDILEAFEQGLIEREIHLDEGADRIYLVIRFNSRITERIMQALHVATMPGDIIWYLYSALRPAGEPEELK